jgi:pyruvate/2-oxoglutarate dehydrogenase complex dihydrolipoamide acyltransferase (E2) component
MKEKDNQANDYIGKYQELPFSKFRQLISDGLDMALEKHYVKALLELDVNQSRKALRQYRRENKTGLSLLAWIIKCIGQALSEHKTLNAMRKKKKIIVFDDVDMSVAIEMSMENEKVPRLYVVRKINQKSLNEIHDEIYSVKDYNKKAGDVELGERRNVRQVKLIMSLPKFIRKLIWKKYLRDPFFVKRMMGTVGITAVGMFGQFRGWPVPLPTSNHSLSFALGSIIKKPCVVKNQVEIREFLSITIFYDHDVIDGAPAARFTKRLKTLIEGGYGL